MNERLEKVQVHLHQCSFTYSPFDLQTYTHISQSHKNYLLVYKI